MLHPSITCHTASNTSHHEEISNLQWSKNLCELDHDHGTLHQPKTASRRTRAQQYPRARKRRRGSSAPLVTIICRRVMPYLEADALIGGTPTWATKSTISFTDIYFLVKFGSLKTRLHIKALHTIRGRASPLSRLENNFFFSPTRSF